MQNEDTVIMRAECNLTTTVTYSTAIDGAVYSIRLLGEVIAPRVFEVCDN